MKTGKALLGVMVGMTSGFLIGLLFAHPGKQKSFQEPIEKRNTTAGGKQGVPHHEVKRSRSRFPEPIDY